MTNEEMLENILSKIPLTNHMGLKVLSTDLKKLAISADFEKNRNHKLTAFGGSVATVLTLCCWSWITNYLILKEIKGFEVSVFKCEINYSKPILETFTGQCLGATEEQDLNQFLKMLKLKGKGRLKLKSFVADNLEPPKAVFIGEFVAYKPK